MWSSHIGIDRNEMAYRYAKDTTKTVEVNVTVSYSKVRSIIKVEMKKKWQDGLNKENKVELL